MYGYKSLTWTIQIELAGRAVRHIRTVDRRTALPFTDAIYEGIGRSWIEVGHNYPDIIGHHIVGICCCFFSGSFLGSTGIGKAESDV